MEFNFYLLLIFRILMDNYILLLLKGDYSVFFRYVLELFVIYYVMFLFYVSFEVIIGCRFLILSEKYDLK